MADDDFDKVDEEFADEFDFVDEAKQKSAAPAAVASSPRSGGGFMPKLIILAVLAGGGYFAYAAMFRSGDKNSKDKPSATGTVADAAAANAATSTQDPATAASDQATPADGTAVATADTTLPATPSPAPAMDGSVDFNQTLGNASQAAAETANKDKLSTALPQGKSFDQVQKDLKAASAPAASAAPVKMVIPDEINHTLDSISEEMTLNVNQIKQLESTISNLASTVDQLNKSISAMDNRVLGLTETVDGLSQDLSNVKKVMTEEDMDLTTGNASSVKFSNKSKTQPLKSSAPDYSVHAIIPGRAWLKSSNGQILTVTEGDKVGDYGTVAVIDAANGLVRTSSGITFR